MAVWVRTETTTDIMYLRADGLHGYHIKKTCTAKDACKAVGQPHWHAEEFFPWGEDAAGRKTATDIANVFEASLKAQGNTIQLG
jgi:hypothetical protein